MSLVSQLLKWEEPHLQLHKIFCVVVSSNEATCLQQLVTSASHVVDDEELERIVKTFGSQRCVTRRHAMLRNLAVRLGDMDQLRYLLTSADQLHMDQLLTETLHLAPADKRKDIILLLLNQTDTKYEISANTNSRHHGKTSFHVAAEYGYTDLLTSLTPTKKENCNTLTCDGETALHCILREVHNRNHCPKEESEEMHMSNLISCLKLLVNTMNVNINIRDNGGYTAVHLACQIKSWNIVEILLVKEANIDIFINNTTARDIITAKNSNIQINYPINTKEPTTDNIIFLFEMIKKKKENDFINEFKNKKADVNVNNGELTLLQATIKHGLYDATKMLLDCGADINERCSDLNTPVMLAVSECNEEILELLLQHKNLDLSLVNCISEMYTVLHLAVINCKADCQCVKLLCEYKLNKSVNINSRDYRNKSALHHAVQRHQDNNIVYLLRHNANIFILNDEQLPAFAGAQLQSLIGYLSDQILIEGSAYDTNEIYNLKLDFQFLVTPTESIYHNKMISESDQDKTCLIEVPVSNCNSPDMQNLLLLAKSKTYKPLLNHYVIRSFLHFKWHRYFWLFYINFMMLAIFTASFSVYIYYLVNDINIVHHDNKTSSDLYHHTLDSRARVPQCLAGITLLFLVVREIFQIYIAVSFWHYISYIVNLVEIALIFMSGFLLFVVSYDYHAIHTLSAVAILLAFSELVILIGTHPVLTIYYTMLFTVGKDFLYFLLWYSLLVVAFGISFYILFQHCDTNTEECSANLFSTIGTSIFKTTVMLQGEFDANNLTFDSFFITSHLIFLFFFFSMVIVLMNLLNGLAVNDIQIIKTEADIICMESQVKLYAKFEYIIFNIINIRFKNLATFLIQHTVLISGLLKENKIQFTLRQQSCMSPDVRNSCNRNCFDCNGGKICGFSFHWLSSKHFKKMFPLCFELENIIEQLVHVKKERCHFITKFEAQIEDERVKNKTEREEQKMLMDMKVTLDKLVNAFQSKFDLEM